MAIAAKFGDPVLGIDVHAVQLPPPAPPAPTPLPHPFVGVVFDPLGAAIGAALGAIFGGGGPVFVNGMPVGNTGTDVKGTAHIPTPPGVSFHPSDIPDNSGTMVTGSKTVNMAGSSMGREMSMVMSCGYPLNMPTSLCMAVPMGAPVNIGGPDTFDFLAAATRGIRTKWFSDKLHKLFKIKPGSRLSRLVCFLTGHPVDVMTGEVVTDLTDFSLPGTIPLAWERNYWSRETATSSLGPGWYGPLDVSLHEIGRGLVVRLPDGRRKPHDALRPGESLWDDLDRYALSRDERGTGYRLTTWDGITYHFARVERASVSHPIAKITDRCLNEIAFQYDRGRCRKVVDTAGRELEISWTKLGRIESVSFEDKPLVRYEYTEDGMLAASFDPLGHSYRYEYRGGVMVKETNKNGLSFYFEYDWDHPEGWCIRTWGDGGIYDRRIRYDKHGHFTMVDDSRGGRTHYWGNVAGLVEKMMDPMGVVTTYEWDDHCRKIAETDGEGHRTEWKHDARGNCIEEKNALGQIVRREYDEHNDLVRVVDPAGGEWRIDRDRNGNPLHVTNPAGGLSRYRFDERGRPVELEDPSGRRVRLGWSAQSDIASLTVGANRTNSFEHDSQGRLVGTVDAAGRRSRAIHDAAGRPTYLEQADGERLSLEHDPEGNLLEQVDSLGRRVSLRYAGLNRLVEQIDPMNHKIRLAYDTEEDLVAVENQVGERYRFDLDRAGVIVRPELRRRRSAGACSIRTTVTALAYEQIGAPTRPHRAAELRAALPRRQRQPCLCRDSHLRAVTALQQTHTRPAGRAAAPRFVQPRVA